MSGSAADDSQSASKPKTSVSGCKEELNNLLDLRHKLEKNIKNVNSSMKHVFVVELRPAKKDILSILLTESRFRSQNIWLKFSNKR